MNEPSPRGRWQALGVSTRWPEPSTPLNAEKFPGGWSGAYRWARFYRLPWRESTVSGSRACLAEPFGEPDARGATTLLDHSWGTAPERREARRRDGNLLVEGRDGSYRFDDEPGLLARLDLEGNETVIGRYKEAGDPWLAAFAGCLGHFAARLRDGAPFESEIDDNLRTLAATLAAYESARTGQVVTL